MGMWQGSEDIRPPGTVGDGHSLSIHYLPEAGHRAHEADTLIFFIIHSSQSHSSLPVLILQQRIQSLQSRIHSLLFFVLSSSNFYTFLHACPQS